MGVDPNQIQSVTDAVVNTFSSGTLQDKITTGIAVLGAVVFSVTKHNLKDLGLMLWNKMFKKTATPTPPAK